MQNETAVAGTDLDHAVTVSYQPLLRLARKLTGNVLEPAALVHETYLRLRNQHSTSWQSQEHFLAIAACLMRRILVDRDWQSARGWLRRQMAERN
jgi:DNA-directed RNA polymerase specialized sigma24 family protein